MPAWLPDGRVLAMPPPPPPHRAPSPPPPPPPAWLAPPQPLPQPLPVALEAPSSPAALLLELFPNLPLDIESLVATLGPEEATRVCFELMASHDASSDAPPPDGLNNEAEELGVPEQLAVLQGYFPDAALEDLFEALSMSEGSVDGAIAALVEAESAAQAQAEQRAAAAPPSGKEKEKVAQLRHAYPVCCFLSIKTNSAWLVF
jgi:hypothetical protein